MRSSSDIDVALVAEGTYPYHHGGVTVWCDQLVRGLPDVRFGVTSIAGNAAVDPVVALPPNVASVSTIRLWGGPDGRSRRLAGTRRRAVAEAHECLLSAMTDAVEHPDLQFRQALVELHRHATEADIRAALSDDDAVDRVRVAMARGSGAQRTATSRRPTVGEALLAADLLEHLLRPLWAPPPAAKAVHCVSNGLAALTGLGAKWATGMPMILTEHGIYLRERYLAADAAAYPFHVRTLLLRFFRQLTAVSYAEADLITPGSEYNVRWQERIGADPRSIRPVHNGVDPAAFPVIRKEPAKPTLVWVGRVDPLKDLETLIRAFALVHRDIPDARLRMFGPTPEPNHGYLSRCRALINDLGLDVAARFEGRVEQIVDAYRKGNVVVLSSASEGFPYTVIEAMASGRATVSTDVGGVREAVGDAGVVVPPRDPSALADACLSLLREPKLRRRLAAAARHRIVREFTLDRFVEVYRGIYGRFIDTSPVTVDAEVVAP